MEKLRQTKKQDFASDFIFASNCTQTDFIVSNKDRKKLLKTLQVRLKHHILR